jgi:hypothetical protein
MDDSNDSAAERKRKRLEAWRRRQQESGAPQAPEVKVSIALGNAVKKENVRRKKSRFISSRAPPPIRNPFGEDVEEDESDAALESKKMRGALLVFAVPENESILVVEDSNVEPPSKRRKGSRWDTAPASTTSTTTVSEVEVSLPLGTSTESSSSSPRVDDALDKFMERLEAGALGSVATQLDGATGTEMLSIDVGGSMMRLPKLQQFAPPQPSPVSGGTITSEQISKLTTKSSKPNAPNHKTMDPDVLYTGSDWESDAQMGETSEVGLLSLLLYCIYVFFVCFSKRIFLYFFVFVSFVVCSRRQMTKKKKRVEELLLKL